MFCWRGAVQANQGPRKTQNPALLPKGQPQAGGESLLKESVSIGALQLINVLFHNEDVLIGWIVAEAV